MDAKNLKAEKLRQDVEGALRDALDPSGVLPLLHTLAKTAAPGSDESLFAHQQLAELLVERHPWRAALHAKHVLASRPDEDRAWAVLGLCQSLLGHYKCAVAAYYRALTCSPKNPWYAHNLGHLLDVALDRADDALLWLRTAYAGAMGDREITSSFAHALGRAGKVDEAKRVLSRSMSRGASREQSALWAWLENGAPSDGVVPLRRPTTVSARISKSLVSKTRGGSVQTTTRKRPRVSRGELVATLNRGITSLPLNAGQRAQAVVLARDAFAENVAADSAGGSLAAAIAYAIVFVDHVPLSQTEVAACFRVSVASLRGRFSTLRSRLDLTPGDSRYVTPRL